MFFAQYKTIDYKGKPCKVIGQAPANKVGCGNGMALLLVIDGKSKYVNTTELLK
ncbi:hypothetical protein [Vibrio sonorensis]|uniref:hypothetical protein n=1 Tax=Vibrio sonorensis TaxID=1004316 RepID=UPI001586A7E2|nr:hypothetical protein [Vibrio sonorensis]